jgi:transposase
VRYTFEPVNFEQVKRDMDKDRTMTLSILWEEYYTTCSVAGKRPYLYSRFCELYHIWCEEHDVTATKRHVPGDLGEFDWAGQTMEVKSPYSDEVLTAYLFVACLPYSQKTFVRAYSDMTMDSWITAAAMALEFFGGTPRLLTIDNLKVGVTKHTSDEIVINRTFREFSEHYNVAVIPHKAAYPRGKASVESNVGKIGNKIRNLLRNHTFFSFEELNSAIVEKLADLNSRPFQKRAGSRDSVFSEKELCCLQPLPKTRFTISHWGPKGTVSKNYHVLCIPDHVYYSVPYRYVGQRVEVRTTLNTVEVFCEGVSIACHVRDKSAPKGDHVTVSTHCMKSHLDWTTHGSEYYRERGAQVGASCLAVIEGFLSSGVAEEEGWQWCEKLLGKLKNLDANTIEEICALAISAVPAPSYKTVNALFKNHSRKDAKAQDQATGDDPWAIRRFK